jgi:S-DNA-T family DNA segregation ATPase FtsK/SpoIIIE
MKQARRSKSDSTELPGKTMRLARETAFLVSVAVALYLFLSLTTYSPLDPGWSNSGAATSVRNLGGRFGAWVADLMLVGFGYVAYLFPIMVTVLGWRIFRQHQSGAYPSMPRRVVTIAGFALTIVGACGLENLHFAAPAAELPFAAGGVLGSLVNEALVGIFGYAGTTVIQLTVFLSGVTFFTGLSWFWLMDRIGEQTFRLFDRVEKWVSGYLDRAVGVKSRRARKDSVKAIRQRLNIDNKAPPRIEPKVRAQPDSGRLEREKQKNLFDTKSPRSTVIPALSLLDPPEAHDQGYSREVLEVMSRLLEKKLADFNIDVQVVEVHPGPVITRFEIEPAPGIKASQIQGLARDLARALSTVSVRVVDNIPGKTVIGLEVPNEVRETVRLVEGLSSRAYEDTSSHLALMLGKNISGVPVIADLCKMPHLLIAGTTGSGKSVCINALILSIVYKSSPRNVRMIMVDPKMLELSVYDGIPHLLTPVVTDMKDAANALRWCIVEMERRYRVMAALGVRNIAGFNRKIKTASDEGRSIPDPMADPETGEETPSLDVLPYIVVVIDELADLMIVVGKKVEELITRLAQKGRASGIHLILATQRPSVDVITGLIKANIPSRIAFQVSSRVDSRTVLDQIGAEHLLGHGDMLYLPPGTSVPERIHGSYVSDQEVHRVAEALKKSGTPEYEHEVLSGPQDGGGMPLPGVDSSSQIDAEDDPLYDQALRIVTETRRASVSSVQRQLRVGYNRAARMIEAMEEAGVVGPLQSNGKREVLAPAPPQD